MREGSCQALYYLLGPYTLQNASFPERRPYTTKSYRDQVLRKTENSAFSDKLGLANIRCLVSIAAR